MLINRVLVLVLCLTGWALAGPGPPHEVPPGQSTSPPGKPTVTKPAVQLCVQVTGLNNPTQRLTYVWEESLDGGLTWQAWTGGDMAGGLRHDKTGQPTTRFCSLSASPTITTPTALLRVQTTIVGPGLTMAFEVIDQ